MKTEELIDVLSTNIEPVDPQAVSRRLQLAIAAGLVLALLIGAVALGIRWDLKTAGAFGFLLFKAAFGIAVTILGSYYLLKHARPGGEARSWTMLVGVPLVVVMILAGVSLSSAPASHWDHMLLGEGWLECLISIPIIAVAPFAIIMAVVRMAAPTDLVRTGALAGLVAGGVSAIAYALHCTDDTLPFVAFWYGGTIVLCTLAGAALGPRILRW